MAKELLNDYVSDLMDKIFSLEKSAFNIGDYEVLLNIHDLVNKIFQIKQLYILSRKNNGKIEEIADNLCISRQMVYFRLESLELSPEDFRDQYTKLESLILKSNNKTFVERVLNSKGDYSQFSK